MKLTVVNLCKKIKDRVILDNINLNLESGNVYGFVGRNGSGKTMLFRAVSGLINIDSGKVMLDEKELHKDMQVLPDMGIILENAGLYSEFTGRKNLQILADIRKKITPEEVDKAIERVGLDPGDKRTYRKYSLGMKQRIVLAQAIMEHPSILFLDEPTTGLDPATRRLVWESIDRMRIQNQMTVFLTTHYMEEAARAQHIAIMDGGKIKEVGTPFDLKEKYAEDTLRLIPVQDKERELTEALQGHSYQKVQEAYHLQVAKSMDALPVLAKAKPYINGFEMIQGTMDDVFLNITGKTLGAGSGEGL